MRGISRQATDAMILGAAVVVVIGLCVFWPYKLSDELHPALMYFEFRIPDLLRTSLLCAAIARMVFIFGIVGYMGYTRTISVGITIYVAGELLGWSSLAVGWKYLEWMQSLSVLAVVIAGVVCLTEARIRYRNNVWVGIGVLMFLFALAMAFGNAEIILGLAG